MPIDPIERALKSFITAPEPQVIALSGRWGRGKTYYWREFIRRYSAAQNPRFTKYSYVSLFGVTSLSELQSSVFENALPFAEIADDVSAITLARNAAELNQVGERPDAAITNVRQAARKVMGPVPGVTAAVNLGPLLKAGMSLAVRDYLVCIDDLERRGSGLSLQDVLGYLSQLRDERQCRVVVILNLDQLPVEDRAQFERLREKVFDHTVTFDPKVEECVDIVFPASKDRFQDVRKHSIALGIQNIRVLKRIRRLIDAFHPHISSAHPRVRAQIAHSGALLALCYYTRGEGHPPYEYVSRAGSSLVAALAGLREVTDEEREWNLFLSAYGKTSNDELDREIGKFLETGTIDDATLKRVLLAKGDQAKRAERDRALSDAWDLFHGGFEQNEAAVIASFKTVVRDSGVALSATTLNAIVGVLRHLEQQSLAKTLVDEWLVKVRKDAPSQLDIVSDPLFAEVTDEHLRAVVSAAYEEQREQGTLEGVVQKLHTQTVWSDADIAVLARATADDFYQLFTDFRGREADDVIRACLQFGTLSDATPAHRTIASRAQEALERIASESPLNRLRVQKFGLRPPKSR